MKKVFGFFLISVLLWSCGSQFSRSKYDRYMWSRSVNSVEKEVTATETNKEAVPKNENKTQELALTENADYLSLAERKAISITNDHKKGKEISELSKQSSTTSTVSHSEKTPQILKKPENLKKGSSKLLQRKIRQHIGTKGMDSDLANILYIVLLVILIILIFTLLDTILGGLLSWILGIVLLVLLIYFILKLLGAI